MLSIYYTKSAFIIIYAGPLLKKSFVKVRIMVPKGHNSNKDILWWIVKFRSIKENQIWMLKTPNFFVHMKNVEFSIEVSWEDACVCRSFRWQIKKSYVTKKCNVIDNFLFFVKTLGTGGKNTNFQLITRYWLTNNSYTGFFFYRSQTLDKKSWTPFLPSGLFLEIKFHNFQGQTCEGSFIFSFVLSNVMIYLCLKLKLCCLKFFRILFKIWNRRKICHFVVYLKFILFNVKYFLSLFLLMIFVCVIMSLWIGCSIIHISPEVTDYLSEDT